MLAWLGKNAVGIQAASSVVALLITSVLAWLTWQYVKLTRELSNASADQVEMMRNQFAATRRQSALALAALCQRLRIPLEGLTPVNPGFKQLKNLSQLSAADIQDLALLARSLDEQAIVLAGKASSALRVLLKLHDRVKAISDTVGWIADKTEAAEYHDARDAAPRRLLELERVARDAAR